MYAHIHASQRVRLNLIQQTHTPRRCLAIAVLLLGFDARTGGPLAATAIGPFIEAAGFWLAVAATVLAVVSAWGYLQGALPILLGRAR